MPESDETPELPPLTEMTDASLRKMVRDSRAFDILKIILGDAALRRAEAQETWNGGVTPGTVSRYVTAAYLVVDAFEAGSR